MRPSGRHSREIQDRPEGHHGPDLDLHRLETAVAKAFNDKDVDALMEAYAPGESLFVFDVVGPPGTYLSWDAYREALKRFFATISGSLRFTMSDLNITASGDIAYGRSLQRVSGTRKDGTKFDYTVRVTDVYRKLGGKWLIVQEHVSLPIDRTTFAPFLNSAFPRA
jgi:ketosteroid isomerase-like protein